jgi:chromosome segregation ATPase
MASSDEMSTTINRLTGGLFNAILGGLILWVGQTTFRHAGILASVDEKLNGIKQQFADVDKRQEGMRKWLENVVSDVKDSSRAQFTADDGEKLLAQVRQGEQFAVDLERRVAERISALDRKLATLEAQHQDSQELASLKMEIAQLRGDLTRAAVAQEVQYQSGDRFARGTPVYLPPVENRR